MRRQRAVRWLTNMGIAILGTTVLTVVSIIVGAPWTESWTAQPIAFLVVTTFLTFMYWILVPAVASLSAIELVAPRLGRYARAGAVAISAGVAVAYAVALAVMWASYPSVAALGYFLIFAVAGAGFGAVMRLPSIGALPSDIRERRATLT